MILECARLVLHCNVLQMENKSKQYEIMWNKTELNMKTVKLCQHIHEAAIHTQNKNADHIEQQWIWWNQEFNDLCQQKAMYAHSSTPTKPCLPGKCSVCLCSIAVMDGSIYLISSILFRIWCAILIRNVCEWVSECISTCFDVLCIVFRAEHLTKFKHKLRTQSNWTIIFHSVPRQN